MSARGGTIYLFENWTSAAPARSLSIGELLVEGLVLVGMIQREVEMVDKVVICGDHGVLLDLDVGVEARALVFNCR